MQHAALDRTALDSLFSHTSHWPPDGDWDRVVRDTAEHLIEHPKTGLLMVLVPAGKFLTFTRKGQPFEVDLPAFYVAAHPVTNAQYARFVAETRHRPPDNGIWQEAGKMHQPVVYVDWDDAIAYCRWAGLRLPTELEWEKAARGLDGRTYPWGKAWNPIYRCRNFQNKGSETTAEVWRYGQGGAPFGGLQFSGNVWEWCADWYDAYAYDFYREGTTAPSYSQCRVLRGGSWSNDDPDLLSCGFRDNGYPCRLGTNDGFRCVRRLSDSL